MILSDGKVYELVWDHLMELSEVEQEGILILISSHYRVSLRHPPRCGQIATEYPLMLTLRHQ